jgi:hypothetical protein
VGLSVGPPGLEPGTYGLKDHGRDLTGLPSARITAVECVLVAICGPYRQHFNDRPIDRPSTVDSHSVQRRLVLLDLANTLSARCRGLQEPVASGRPAEEAPARGASREPAGREVAAVDDVRKAVHGVVESCARPAVR